MDYHPRALPVAASAEEHRYQRIAYRPAQRWPEGYTEAAIRPDLSVATGLAVRPVFGLPKSKA